MDFTRFTNLEVTGVLKNSGIKEADFKITSADAAAAAGATPTKAEFDAVVALANELKADLNKLVKQLTSGSAT